MTRRLVAALLSISFLTASLLGGAVGCTVGATPRAETAVTHHTAHGQHGSPDASATETSVASSTADVPADGHQQPQCDMAMACSMFASRGEAVELSDRQLPLSDGLWARQAHLLSVGVAPEPPPPRA